MIEVDVSRVISRTNARVIGINMDYLVDHDDNRPVGARPLEEALKEMGVRSLRFPGGDKSDNHLWSVPPFERPQPEIACGPRLRQEDLLINPDGAWKVRRMDFDDFMGLCKRVKAEPTVVICYDALFTPGCMMTRQRLLDTAVAWVAYARKRRYRVKYWEIGNESYIDATVSPYDYARDFIEFAKAMKAADPSIWVGANGPPGAESGGAHEATKETPWWKIIYEVAAQYIDFAPVHVYSCYRWGSYEHYRDHSPGYPEASQDAYGPLVAARKYGPPGFADRLRVAVTETNSADFSEDGWPFVNSFGHALVTFDIFGTLLELDRIDNAQLWNTRWVSHKPDTPSLWDAVDDLNQLQPTGKVLAIWSRFFNEQMVAVSEPTRMRTFASYSPQSGRLSLFLINKDVASREFAVKLANFRSAKSARRWLWSAPSPDGFHPTWQGPKRVPVNADEIRVSLPPDSLTILALRKARA